MTTPENALSPAEAAKIANSFSSFRKRTAEFEEEIRPAFNAAPRSIPCPEHEGVFRQRDWDETVWKSWRDGSLQMVYCGCPKCESGEVSAKQRQFWARRGVPSRIIDATLDNFDPIGDPAKVDALGGVRAFASKAARDGGFLFLLGDTGNGKGHLAVGVLRIVGNGFFTTQADLLTNLRETYKTTGTAAFLDKMKETTCLVIDEFGMSVGGRDEAPMFYQILAARHDKRLPTIITSNEELPAITKELGYRLIDRIREDYKVVVLRGPSYRTVRETAEK